MRIHIRVQMSVLCTFILNNWRSYLRTVNLSEYISIVMMANLASRLHYQLITAIRPV